MAIASLAAVRGSRQAAWGIVRKHITHGAWSWFEGDATILVLLEPDVQCAALNMLHKELTDNAPITVRFSLRVRPRYVERATVEAAYRLGGLVAAEKILWGLP